MLSSTAWRCRGGLVFRVASAAAKAFQGTFGVPRVHVHPAQPIIGLGGQDVIALCDGHRPLVCGIVIMCNTEGMAAPPDPYFSRTLRCLDIG